MLLDKLSGYNKTIFKIAQAVSKLPKPTIENISSDIFNYNFPEIQSILIDDVTNFNYDLNNYFSISLRKESKAKFDDLANLYTLPESIPSIEVIKFELHKSSINGKFFTKKKELTLLTDRVPKAENAKVKTGTNTSTSNCNIFDIIFPALYPPIIIDQSNSVSIYKPLFAFQVDGIKFLNKSNHALLADEMGLGKSIQAIIAARLLFREGKISKACIVCPKAVLSDWENKLNNWAPELRVIKVHGEKINRDALWLSNGHIYISTYETIQRDLYSTIQLQKGSILNSKRYQFQCLNKSCNKNISINICDLFEITKCPFCKKSYEYPKRINAPVSQFDLLIIDEIQKIKNPSAQNTKSIRKIKSLYIWALTGTPLENKLEDLITICETIKPGLFINIDKQDISEVIETYKSIMLRRKKIDALKDLPPKLTKEVWLDLLPKQRKSYDLAEKKGIIALSEKGDNVTITHVFDLIIKLKQICNYDRISNQSSKLDYLLEELDELTTQGDKALVFSQYPNSTLKEIFPYLKKYNPTIYDGSLSDIKRSRIIEDFQHTDNSKLMLISLKAGNAGITLTKANYVYHFDLWWNPAVSAQAVDRTHRIGQTKTVFERFLLMENTIESRIYSILSAKKKLFNDVVDGYSDRNIVTNSLTEEEMFSLFNLKKQRKKP